MAELGFELVTPWSEVRHTRDCAMEHGFLLYWYALQYLMMLIAKQKLASDCMYIYLILTEYSILLQF